MTQPINSPATSKRFSRAAFTMPRALTSPSDYYRMLDSRIVGHDRAKRKIAVQLAMKKKQTGHKKTCGQPNTCMLLLGPSGVGKTYLMETAARVAGFQLMALNASQLTAEGYRGVNLSSVMGRLQYACLTQQTTLDRSILFLDEWDKRIMTGGNDSQYALSLQHEMLRIMEGKPLELDDPQGEQPVPISLDSSGLMLVFAGTFHSTPGTDSRRKPIGFESVRCRTSPDGENDEIKRRLFDSGMLPEFYNRLTTIITLDAPQKENLRKMLLMAGGELARCNERINPSGLQIALSPDASEAAIEYAMTSRLYARGLKRLLDAAANDLLFEGIHGHILLDPNDIQNVIAGKSISVEENPETEGR